MGDTVTTNAQIAPSKVEKPISGTFDVLKALFIFGLPFVHIIESAYALGQLADDFYATAAVITFLSDFGPNIFMICMGIGLARNNSPKRLRKIGIQMLIINVALNIIRIGAADFVGVIAGVYSPDVLVESLFGSDIYMFVGLFLISYSYLKELKLSSESIFAISIVALIINVLVSMFVTCDIPVLERILPNFVSCGIHAWFPLLGWFIYPCVGILIEEKLFAKSESLQKRGMGILFLLGILCLAISILIISISGTTLYDTFYNQMLYNAYNAEHVFILFGVAFITIALAYFIYMLIPKNPIEKFLISFSILLFPFYLIQWVFIGLIVNYPLSFATFFASPLTIDFLGYIILIAICLGGSFFITYKWGFSISRWVFRVSDYTKWFKRKKRA